MPAESFSTDCLSLTYRPDLGQLTGRWLRSVSEAELSAGYDALRRAALHHACGYWLIDARRRTTRSLNGPEWITTQFLPRMQRELGLPLYACFLVLPGYLSSLAVVAPAAPGSPVQFALFVDEGAANAWLLAGMAS